MGKFGFIYDLVMSYLCALLSVTQFPTQISPHFKAVLWPLFGIPAELLKGRMSLLNWLSSVLYFR